MAIETLVVGNERTPLDLLLWRRFGREVPGLVEATLARQENIGLADLGPFPPPGTRIAVETPDPRPKARRRVISLFG